MWYFVTTSVPSVNYCDGLDRCILYCILFVFMFALLCFCVATEFSVNKDLYIKQLWREYSRENIIQCLVFFCSCSYLFTFLLSSRFYWHIRLNSTTYFLTRPVCGRGPAAQSCSGRGVDAGSTHLLPGVTVISTSPPRDDTLHLMHARAYTHSSPVQSRILYLVSFSRLHSKLFVESRQF